VLSRRWRIDAEVLRLGALGALCATCQRAFRQHRSRLGLEVSIKNVSAQRL